MKKNAEAWLAEEIRSATAEMRKWPIWMKQAAQFEVRSVEQQKPKESRAVGASSSKAMRLRASSR